MAQKILITGGGGFLGSYLTELLIQSGYQVCVLDNLSEQVHGQGREYPSYLNPSAEFIRGDLKDSNIVDFALTGVDAVIHLAAIQGVGQSMYRLLDFTEQNIINTSVLLECLLRKPTGKIIIGSTMAVYGEGMYMDRNGKPYPSVKRDLQQLKEGKWEISDSDGEDLIPMATPEFKPLDPVSVYGLSKLAQERMALMVASAYHIPCQVLRFSNLYGPRQALHNPYQGILAIFGSSLLNNKQPLIFEDGFQLRDFVHVSDAAVACKLALEFPGNDCEIFNIGSGKALTLREAALKMAIIMEKNRIVPDIIRKYRTGDVRHCFPDINKAKNHLGFSPKVSLDEGLMELADWLKGQEVPDRINEASSELTARGLTV